MPRHFWNLLLVVAVACIVWALWLAPSPANNFYRFGYGLAGALSILSFICARAHRQSLAIATLLIGSVAYLSFPARTTARLLITGEWALLAQTFSATFHVPYTVQFSTLQSVHWFIDLFVFQVAIAMYFLALLIIILAKAAFHFSRGSTQHGA